MATLKDIAKHANVSACTVSRYLNSNIVVKKTTEARIQQAIKELGYIPNVVAKALKRNETSNVAVILPKINNLYYSEITSGISQTLSSHHYNLFVYEVDNQNMNEEDILQLMRENMIAGIIFIGLFSDKSFQESIQSVLEWEIPVVYANRCIPYKGFPLVYPDLVKAGKLGAEHLFSKGKSKLAIVHKHLPNPLLDYFIEGFRQAGDGACEPVIMVIEEGRDLPDNCVSTLLENKIDGVFVLNELSAIYLTKALNKSDIRIVQDMAVLSLGNSLMSEISTPELSCVDLQNRELGVRSAEMILGQIRKQEIEPVTVLEPLIIERNST
ncbi:LacI family DNA-binding transcriptional regulator [Paenibacillus sp. UNC499MF]|uniref:LacI family DNA-binding transcriptional regulator n=1 Tax=Paenibacillus sp. UNC499MF TaxID=1502751 RepID=UPI00089FA48D|nr:LacI family DNA-binding transcriptional regulator [Paenibacillus sp. UNC499MF]SEG24208.1 transcriptional regulator, LacI family [Paenibacillus sp. UNC499MF]